MSFFDDLLGGGGGGGISGSSSEIKSPDTTTNTETRAATGQSYADRGSQAISGFQLQDSASVTLTDLGAVGSAFEFTKQVIDAALNSSSKANKDAISAFESASSREGAVDADSLVKLGLVALVLLGGAIAFVGSRR